MNTGKVVIIRRNSGSGKSTIARLLHEQASFMTVLMEQDYLRRTVLREKERAGADNIALITQTVLFALQYDYNVILEGIWRYMLARSKHIDVSFAETHRWHATKPNAADFGETEMRQWYRERDLLHIANELIIAETLPAEQTVAKILSETGL